MPSKLTTDECDCESQSSLRIDGYVHLLNNWDCPVHGRRKLLNNKKSTQKDRMAWNIETGEIVYFKDR